MNKETEWFNLTLDIISKADPETAEQIKKELEAQRSRAKCIASENYDSLSVLAAASSLTIGKYSEGTIGHRYYSSCEQVDAIEQLAADRAKELFNAEYAYVQPNSGTDANTIAYSALINYLETEKNWPKDTKPRLLSLDVKAGGHLTHSNPINIVSRLFEVHTYGVEDDGWLDYDNIRRKALEVKPQILLAGYSAYPRKINFSKFKEIADETGALLMCDMAHFAGLVAGKAFTGAYNPIPYCDLVTSTTQKTLRSGRGGIILAKSYLSSYIDKGCPLAHGGSLNNMIAAKAVGFAEALKPEFKKYAQQTILNCKALADSLLENGINLQTGGTDNHLLLINLTNLGITGRQAESALLECNIVTNRNAIPNDPNGAWYTSGIRMGSAALTSRGFKEADMKELGEVTAAVLKNIGPVEGSKAKYTLDPEVKTKAIERIARLLATHPLYPEIETT